MNNHIKKYQLFSILTLIITYFKDKENYHVKIHTPMTKAISTNIH